MFLTKDDAVLAYKKLEYKRRCLIKKQIRLTQKQIILSIKQGHPEETKDLLNTYEQLLRFFESSQTN